MVPGAVPASPQDSDPGLIALWESDQAGSAAYDFYVDALPAAGYPIVGVYPGGEVALIRFLAPDGQVWQMVAHGLAGGTRGHRGQARSPLKRLPMRRPECYAQRDNPKSDRGARKR